MTDKHIITDGCKFQSDCIEYKDISYLKIMPICAIHELSIACHDKVNKCKYYKLYKQLQEKEKECEKLKKQLNQSMYLSEGTLRLYAKRQNIKYKQALDEIEEFCTVYSANHDAYETVYKYILEIINKAKEK